MNIKEISVDLIDTPSYYFKQEDPTNLIKLENSIRNFGLLRPIVVREIGTRYECVEGRQILKVINNLQQKSIFCVLLQSPKEQDVEALNLILNILHPQDSLARIAHFMKQRVELVGESQVANYFPYSIDEIKRFVEICTFDWKQFEKKQNGAQGGMFDILEEQTNEQEIIAATEEIVIAGSGSMQEEKIEPEAPVIQLTQKQKEVQHEIAQEGKKKNIMTQEALMASLKQEVLAEKQSQGKGKKKEKTEEKQQGGITNLFQ